MSTDSREQLQAALGSAYTLTRELGGAGMSRVFVAHETALGRDIVVKMLAPELAEGLSVERFMREIRTAAALQAPHIVPVLTAGVTTAGLPYYTMPFVAGDSLRARLQAGALPLPVAVNVLRDVLAALEVAHAQGIVHRDIKPENVLFSGRTAVVTDFGIAKALQLSTTGAAPLAPTGLTQAGLALGTPAYMAPEQALGDTATDHRADLYAWGVMAYELLSGRAPFADRGSVQALLLAHVAEVPAALPASVPESVAAVVLATLVKAPQDRPASASAVRAALDAAMASLPSPGPVLAPAESREFPAQKPETAHVPRRGLAPRSVTSVIMGGAALVLVASALWYWRGRGTERASVTAKVAASIPKSVVVLPLVNTTGDTANAYFAQGMTDEVTSALARLPGVRVASRNSALSVDMTKPVDVKAVAARLNVGNVLEGRMRRSGDQFRITLQLTHASDGLSLWSGSFDGDMRNMFEVQERVARVIAEALRVPLLDGFRVAKGTRNPAAHDLVLRARFLADEYTQSSMREAVALFEKATILDSTYVDAWAGLAEAWMRQGDDFMPARLAVIPARRALQRALALDSTNADALGSLGEDLFYYRRQRTAGIATMRRALASDPTNESVQIFLAAMLIQVADTEAAATTIMHVDSLYPASRLRFRLMSMNEALAATGRLPMAERVCKLAMEVNAAQYGRCAVWLLLYQGKLEQALSRCRALSPAQPSFCAYILGRMGRLREAQEEAASVERSTLADGNAYHDPLGLATMWASAGDFARSMRWLRQVEADGHGSLARTLYEPPYLSMRGYAPFDSLASRIKVY